MTDLKKSIKSIAVLAVLFLGGPSAADVSGMLKICAGCHGDDGLGTDADTPIIAGLPVIVQEDAIYAYIDGARDCGTKPMMCKSVARLTEEQIIGLAEHFAAMSYAPAEEEFDAALAEAGKAIHDNGCAICHGEDDPGDADASILHGQRKAYLRYSLQQYAAGERQQLPAMEKKTSVLSGDDIEALVNYYASFRN